MCLDALLYILIVPVGVCMLLVLTSQQMHVFQNIHITELVEGTYMYSVISTCTLMKAP